jgi:very-short-patch-repair endonuclease
MSKKTGRIINCEYCGKEVYKQLCFLKKNKHHFCSGNCAHKYYGKIIGQKLSKKIKVKCDFCDKTIWRIPSKLRIYKHHFCSRRCLGKHTYLLHGKNNLMLKKGRIPWNKGLADRFMNFKCKCCGKQGKDYKSSKRKFCSKQCARIFIAKNRISSIEKIINRELHKLNIKFISQWSYNSLWVADFYLPKYKLVIECDGDYFHALPERRRMDIKKDKWFKNNGLNILRLTEKEIKNNKSVSVSKIKTKIRRIVNES